MYKWSLAWEECAFVVTWSSFDNWSTFRSLSFFNLVSWVLRLQFPEAPFDLFFGGICCWGLKVWGWRRGGWEEGEGVQNFALFPPPAPNFTLCYFLWGLLVELWSLLFLGAEIFWVGGTLFDECNTSITTFHKSRTGILYIRKPSHFCSVELYYPHDNTIGSHSCDEYRISKELNVCHKLVSIWWPREQLCSRTKECQVYQFEPNTSIPRPFESIHRVILRLFPTPPSWSCDHPSKALKLCAIAMSFWLPIHNTSPRTSSMSFHVVGPRNRFCAKFHPAW